MQLKSQDSTQTQVLPYQTEYQYSNELAEGQSQIIRKGISGTRTVITRNYIADTDIVKSEGQDKVNGERNYQIPTTQKGLSSVEVNKQAGKSVSFSENPSTPNKPVSTETEKLTEQEKAVAVKERESDRRFPVTELP